MPLMLTSISSVVASQMPGYVSYALMRVLIGAGSEGWSENIQVLNKYTCTNIRIYVYVIRLLFSFIVAFALMMEIVGSKEEVRDETRLKKLPKM